MELIDFHTHQETAEGVVTPRSFGIHPWKADNETAAEYNTFKALYLEYFAAADIIGECGLDKVCDVPFEVQMRLFRWQIELSRELRKPMVIHCVRAFNELVQIRKVDLDETWVVHGFTGSLQLAEQLWKSGIWVSYGAALLDNRRKKVRDCLKDNPNPFLLETDDNRCGIQSVYEAAAEIKNCTLQELSDTIKARYVSLITKKATE